MADQPPRKRRTSFKELLKKHSPIKKSAKPVKKLTDEPVEHYTQIIKGVWVGNYKSAKNKDFCKKHNIKAILNCTPDLPNTFCAKNIEYMKIPVEDSLKDKDIQKMVEFLPAAAEFIHKHVDVQNHNILVHCWAGRQRSAISVAAYLVKYKGMLPSQAIKFVQSQRVEAFHGLESINFQDSLVNFYKNLHKQNKR
jgi:protein-tyrosine phosphatase